MLEHLREPEQAISAIYGILKPAGTFIMSTPIAMPLGYLIPLLGKEKLSSHPSVKRAQVWATILREAGFSAIKFEMFLLLPIPATIFNRYFTVDSISVLASHVRMVARKTQ